MPFSQVLAEAKKLRQRQLACTGVSLSMLPSGRKHLVPKPRWQKTDFDTCLSEVVGEDDNALMLNTGDHSDIIALDLDVPKADDQAQGRLDAVQVMQALFDAHPLPADTPIQITGSGGRHVLFSLSKSLGQGLHSAKNATKVRLPAPDGGELRPSTMDIRGDNGGLIVFPSQYQGLDGQMHAYRWETPPGNKDELPAMPDWLISR